MYTYIISICFYVEHLDKIQGQAERKQYFGDSVVLED